MAYVYRHIRLDKNEVFYVGIGKNSNGKFQRAFTKNKSRKSKFWVNIIEKTPYEVEIMLDNLTWKEACEKEREFIKLYGRKDLGTGTLVNMTDGGEGGKGRIITKEQKEVLSKIRIGRKASPETREKMRRANLGKKIPLWMKIKFSEMYGKLVLNTQTGIYYRSIKEASDSCHLSHSVLWSALSGKTKTKTDFIYA